MLCVSLLSMLLFFVGGKCFQTEDANLAVSVCDCDLSSVTSRYCVGDYYLQKNNNFLFFNVLLH